MVDRTAVPGSYLRRGRAAGRICGADMDLIYAYIIAALFVTAIITFALGAIGPGIALLLVTVVMTYVTQQ